VRDHSNGFEKLRKVWRIEFEQAFGCGAQQQGDLFGCIIFDFVKRGENRIERRL